MTYEDNYLAHYGVPGMKWGVRRYVDKYGQYTQEGLERQRELRRSIGEQNSRPATVTQKITQALRNKVKSKVEATREKNKPVSQMTDQELNDRINRLRREQDYKRLKDEAEGNNKPKESFGQKHPLLKRVLMDTATTTLASIATQELQDKADQWLAPMRKERAEANGSLDPELAPFQQFTANRNRQYNNSKEMKAKNEEATQKRINDAVNAAVQETKDAFKIREAREVKLATKSGRWLGSEKTEKKVFDVLSTLKSSAKDPDEIQSIVDILKQELRKKG